MSSSPSSGSSLRMVGGGGGHPPAPGPTAALQEEASTGAPPIEPGPSSTPTATLTPSNAAEVAQCLEFRGVEPTEAEYDTRFDGKEAPEAIVRGYLERHLELSAGPLDRCMKGLVHAFNGTYKKEEHFNLELFKAMSQCFEADNGSKFSVEFFPPKKEWSEAKKIHPKFMVITKRRSTGDEPLGSAVEQKEGEEEKGCPDGPCRSAASAGGGGGSVASGKDGKPFATDGKRRKKSGDVRGGSEGGGPTAGGGGWDRRDPFLAYAQFVASRAESVDEASAASVEPFPPGGGKWLKGEGPTFQSPPPPERILQRREYALGYAREVKIAPNKYRIVKKTSRLDHAIVVFSRDPANNSSRDGGWTVCQVLATVEIKMEDSTCDEFATMCDEGRVGIESSDLAEAKAAPLGQEVLYTLGHVAWGRAALGLELPASLPLAVVAARRVGGPDSSRRMRWVYGSLIIPEACGGEFSFNVSSFGAFRDTEPESAAAVYMTVFIEGLVTGERWIESMQADMATKKAPPMLPLNSDERGPSPPDEDTRPRPRSLCGRRVYFGGSPLKMSGMELVATPACMRKMEFPVSQGELYRGRVNLAELRNEAKGELYDVLWCPEVSLSPSADTVDIQQNARPPVNALENATRSEALGEFQTVVIKVTSIACHRMLLPPLQALLWKLEDALEDGHNWSERVQRVLPLISRSLHALHLTGGFNRNLGLVQIMPDLQVAGYLPLRPSSILDRKRMCNAFKDLIAHTLVPLALHGVVHADIRSSYHETANILYRSQADQYSMLLIDLDSLMDISHYKYLPRDQRILSRKNGPYSRGIDSALEFVCLQSVCIATSWLIGKQMPASGSLELELKTETIIAKYLGTSVEQGKVLDKKDRKKFFSALKSDPCSFVLEQVDPILEAFLGEQ